MKSPYENISSRSFGYICRTCLRHNDELFMIDEIDWEGIQLLETFKLTTLRVYKNDQLPKQMCKNCIKLMYQTYDFLYKCKLSQQTVKRIFEREKKGIFDVGYQTESNKNGTIDQNNLTSNSNDNSSYTSIDEASEEAKNAVDIFIEEETQEEETLYIEVVNDESISQNGSNLRKKPGLKRKRRLRNFGFLKCLSCAALFSTEEEMQKHKNETHKKNFKYECEYCNSKFVNNTNLMDHIRIHTKEKPFQCPSCEEKFTFKSVLNRHMLTHLEEKPFKCGSCERSFSRKYAFDQHERQHRGIRIFCVYCRKEFLSPLALIKHNKNFHEEKDTFQCDVCGNILHSEKSFQEHLTLHGPRNFQCESCGKAFSSARKVETHIKMTHSDMKFACNLCDRKYKQRNTLLKHQQQHRGKFSCEICSKMFVFKASLSQHMRLHKGDTKYQCKECKTICMNKRRLESHIRSHHTKEKPFPCSSCGKCFADKTNLLAHRKIHKETLNCNVCFEGFKDIDTVKAHISLHHS